MSEDSFESAEDSSQSGSTEFFDELDNQVNGAIIDDTEATQSPIGSPITDDGSNNVTSQSSDSVNWEKRYKDSSREAVKWRDKYKGVEGFVPVLDAMKNDSGLVEHVRDYLVGGGKPAKSIQEHLNLGEDFMFDQHEAMTNPDSDSAKLMNAHVDQMVKGRVGQMIEVEKGRAIAVNKTKTMQRNEQEFREKTGMNDEQFGTFKERAQEHVLTLDDVHYLLNRDQAAANVAKNTKQDMIKQMKNVRSMPTSASGANSQGGSDNTPDRDVFNAILGFESDKDNLFG
jgi:hypothetical protein